MDRQKLKDELMRDEASRGRPYRDSNGFQTIGIGHNLDAKPLSAEAIEFIFYEDVADVVTALDKFIPWWRSLTEVRQRVLANMCFNLGIRMLLEFQKMLAALQGGAYDVAAAEMQDSAWFSQVGDRATRLQTMMKEG